MQSFFQIFPIPYLVVRGAMVIFFRKFSMPLLNWNLKGGFWVKSLGVFIFDFWEGERFLWGAGGFFLKF